jgi:hypothetical protein
MIDFTAMFKSAKGEKTEGIAAFAFYIATVGAVPAIGRHIRAISEIRG